jgi:hypothetical protein
LDEELADWCPVVHGVEGGNFVNALRGHLEPASDLVHDADAGEAMLTLSKIEKGHASSLLVLGRVALEDLGDDGLVLLAELEGDVGVVVIGVAVLVLGVSLLTMLPLTLSRFQVWSNLAEGAQARSDSPPGECRWPGMQYPRKREVAASPHGLPIGLRSGRGKG